MVRKNVVRISQDAAGVSAETEDGDVYKGDILIGADGINSLVRQEMWSLADRLEPGYIGDVEKNGEAHCE